MHKSTLYPLFILLISVCSCAPSAETALTASTSSPASEAQILDRKNEEGLVLVDGDTLTFVYEGDAETVELCCGLQESLERLPNSAVWTYSQDISKLSEAIISYFFIVDGSFPQTEAEVWRGPDAPSVPTALEPSPGRITERTLQSEVLDESRLLTVYLPPDHEALKLLGLPVVYLADGDSVREYAKYVEPLIQEGKLPQLMLVGIASGTYAGDPAADYDPQFDIRARDYIPDEEDDRFFLHERFVLEEVLPWAQENFGASDKREQRAVHGYSNGGVFATAIALRNPDVFAYAMPFSVGINPTDVLGFEPVDVEFYFVAGQLEEGFFRTTSSLSERFSNEGMNSQFTGRVAGHDFVMWQEAFPEALLWAFGTQP